MTRFQKLALATTTATFALIGVGGLVRATGSGEGCPTWPGCYPGRVLPPVEYHALIEFSHRSITIVDVVLIGILAVAAIRAYRNVAPVLWGSVAAGVLVVVQAALGAIVVKGDLHATLVTAHFATAMLL